MMKFAKLMLSILGALFVLLASAQSLSFGTEPVVENTATATPAVSPTSSINFQSLADIDGLPLQDNQKLYQFDDTDSIVTIYLTVRKGNAADNTDFTWREVNDLTKWLYIQNEVARVGKAEAIVQIGDEQGPLPGEVGYEAVVPNATVQVRGATSSRGHQKSYRIELSSSASEWRGQSIINLNKHIYDDTRVRNKLNFDLMKQIPNMVSLRTQFVHLYVKDQTVEPWETTFVDYGLFTQIEQPNRSFLRNHLLDQDGQLYKANHFAFYRYEDQIRLADDPLYDENVFSLVLETRGDQDHSKLIQMLEDVNNYEIPIEPTFEKYFNADNYFTWLAYNILVGNADTQSQNFFLYSPRNANKWYFIPWDYDGTFMLENHQTLREFLYAPWEHGVSNYWGGVLHKRVLRVKKYRQSLDVKINELRSFLTAERISSMLDIYKPVVDPYLLRMPDSYYASDLRTRELVFELIPAEIETNYELYVESLKKPMPFYLATPEILDDNELSFSWDEAYDFEGRDITYQFRISTDWDFKNIVFETTSENKARISIDMLEPGIYFWQVIATNSDGQVQQSFDFYVDADSFNHYGMKYLQITPDGEIIEE